jgi:hypothetical protein
MKRRLSALSGIVLLIIPAAHAQFNVTTNNGTITITSYTGTGGDVTIPDTINGLPVTSIGDFAFLGTSLTSVTIPNSVTGIGDYAFDACLALTGVTIPNSVTNIGHAAFLNCDSLPDVTIPASVSNIGTRAFDQCPGLQAITVVAQNVYYSSVNGVLFDKSQNTLIRYPESLEGSYTIPSGVCNVGGYAFRGCLALTSVTMPNSVTNIADYAFDYCFSLTNFTVGAQNAFYSSVNGVLFDKSQNTLIACPEGLGGSYTIPDFVTNIGTNAFAECISLTNVTISGSVTNIGDYAFYFCYSLSSVMIGTNVTALGDGVFYASGLTSVTIPNSVSNIGAAAFEFCSRLTSVMIGSGVTSIGGWAFIYGTSLTNISVDAQNPFFSSMNGVLFNKNQTTLFAYPGGLIGSYTIPGSVTNIGGLAFFGCTGLTSAYFLGNAPAFGGWAFWQSSYGPWPLPVTVYYLPGTTGWDSINLGVPIAVWLPQVQTGDASFGVQSNQFGFNINWASGQTVVVEACTNLTNPVWQPVQTNTLTSDSAYFSDPQWTNYPARFYRLRSP